MIEELPSNMNNSLPLIGEKNYLVTDNSAHNSFYKSKDIGAGRYLVFTAFLVEKYASSNKPDDT